ncbi:MAG TPA: N-acetylmuramoyl-L-alanine amidase [Gemmatimonadaceae bacterium]|jgi:N-acetylmuramoyl-L-alanine amidase|nr:N-acetylmuramoyl-L-alanine amidase [Gemmatimonadaceae bacterium]
MIGLLFFLQTAIAAPPNLVVRQGEAVRVVPVIGSTTGAYIRADLLAAALGGSVANAPNAHYRLTLGDTKLELVEGVPFLRAGTSIVPMMLPALRSGSTFLLPYQVVSALIPKVASGYFYDNGSRELRIFTTVVRHPAEPQPVQRADIPPTIDNGGVSTAPSTARRAARRGTRYLVVVDAGHGGPDNGMTGPIGGGPRLVEKDITLSVAKLLAQELRGDGVDVLMTRTTDTLIALSDRGRIANRNKGDVFVSIHVNATGSRGSAAARERGFETYFLAEAKSEDARRVEKMENEAVRFETGAYAPKGDPLSFIINDMAQNEHLRESNDLAETIQQGLKEFHPGPSRGVQQANFAVLRGSYMPAVLVEIGFGTNPEEASYLSDYSNQREIAKSIAQSVLDYISHYEARVSGGTK